MLKDGQPPTLTQAWLLAEAFGIPLTAMLPLDPDPRPPGLDRLIDAVGQGDAAEARSALAALLGAPLQPNPEDPASARLLDAVSRHDAHHIRLALAELLPGEVYDRVVGGVALSADERARLADAMVLVGQHLVREGQAVAKPAEE